MRQAPLDTSSGWELMFWPFIVCDEFDGYTRDAMEVKFECGADSIGQFVWVHTPGMSNHMFLVEVEIFGTSK